MSEPAAPPPSVLQAGGALGLDKLYVERPADRELHRALSAGEFCYVLAPRQSGKSSLRVRTAARLRAAGVLCATLDLTQIGVKVTLDEWYFGLIDMISERLSLPDPGEFWEQRRQVSPVQRMLRYLRDVVLAQVAQPVVLFIDEIDTVLALDLPRDDFFAAIRSLYNQRAEDPKCHRLTFCLLGVAAPADLMRDPSRTPFNIGQDIRLDDFTTEEAAAFLPCLAGEEGPALLHALLGWTAGHPYMTHRLCRALQGTPSEAGQLPAGRVAALVQQIFLQPGHTAESSLAVIDSFFRIGQTSHADGDRLRQMLALYERLLRKERIESAPSDPVQMALRMTGLIVERLDSAGPVLQVRNLILERTFDRDWLDERKAGAPSSAPLPAVIQAGMRIGPYILGRRLARGNFGESFDATQAQSGARVAIKVVRPRADADAPWSMRLLHVARAFNGLTHAGLVPIVDVGQLPGGEVYIVSQLIEGDTLAERLRAKVQLPVSEACGIALQLALAMEQLHSSGIVYSDLKPRKVMLSAAPDVRGGQRAVLLCSLSAQVGETEGAAAVSSWTRLSGTPLYTPPEQWQSTAARSGKSDVYSLGILLYQMLTGSEPFADTDELAIAKAHADTPLPPIAQYCPQAPRGLTELLIEMTAKSPSGRPSMAEVAKTLVNLEQESRRTAIDPAPSPRLRRFAQASGLLWLISAALIAVAGWQYYRQSRVSVEEDMVAVKGALTVPPFAIDRYEVTNRDYAAWLNGPSMKYTETDKTQVFDLAGALLLDLRDRRGISFDGKGGRLRVASGMGELPVVGVTWQGAVAYCQQFGKRLPTDREWQLAARGATANPYPWGADGPSCEGVVFGRFADGPCATLTHAPEPVGSASRDVTPDGISDLGGNVSEWVADTWPVDSAQRLIRGGNWRSAADSLQVQAGHHELAEHALDNVGFRCARSR